MTLLPFPSVFHGRGVQGELPPPPPPPATGFDLNFAVGQYIVGGTSYASLDAIPGCSFIRAGEQGAVDGVGAVGYFPANVPAINDLGYHVCEALTNRCRHSGDLTQAVWTKRGTASVVTDGQTKADGSDQASKLTVGYHGDDVYQDVVSAATAAGQIYTPSFMLKTVTTNEILLMRNPAAEATEGQWNIDLSLVGSGWERITKSHPAVTVVHDHIGAAGGAGGIWFRTLSGNPATFYIDAAAVIQGDIPDAGPIIRTSGSAVSIGSPTLSLAVANGDYVAAYTFDDQSTQQIPTSITGGVFDHPVSGTLSRGIVKRALLQPI